MKYQCIHSDTGLCETCFKYEMEIEKLKDMINGNDNPIRAELEQLKEQLKEKQKWIEHYAKENEKLNKKLKSLRVKP